MTSKRRHEGYLLIDNRNNEGVPDELLMTMPVPLPKGAGRGVFEAPTITCSHCQAIVIMNPLRNRERAYCPKCDHYICDKCGVIRAQLAGECSLYRKKIDDIQEQDALDAQRGLIVVST